MGDRWTPEAKLRQAQLIRMWAPWERSSGPRTVEGKARASQNSYKPNSANRELRSLKQKTEELIRQAKEIQEMLVDEDLLDFKYEYHQL